MSRWQTLEERFLPRRNPAENGCIEWTGASNGRYGVIYGKGRKRFAHRLAWELANGEIPEGLCVCHRCDNPKCVNAEHLFLGTMLDNMADARSKGRTLPQRGILNKHCKLTEADVLEIRKMAGELHRVIAAKYGIDKSVVSRIIGRKSWRHLC